MHLLEGEASDNIKYILDNRDLVKYYEKLKDNLILEKLAEYEKKHKGQKFLFPELLR